MDCDIKCRDPFDKEEENMFDRTSGFPYLRDETNKQYLTYGHRRTLYLQLRDWVLH